MIGRLCALVALILVYGTSSADAFTGIRGSNATNQAATGTTVTITHVTARVEAGDVCVIFLGIRTSDVAVVSIPNDDQGGVWTQRKHHTGGATYGSQTAEIWTSINPTGNQTVVTPTSDISVSWDASMFCLTGSPAAITLTDSSTGETDNSTTHQTGSVSCNENGILVLATSEDAAVGTPTVNADYTELVPGARSYIEYKIPTGTFSSNGAWTSASSQDTISTQVCITDSASVATTPRGLLLGVLP